MGLKIYKMGALLNLKAVDGVATVDVDTILMFVWKTCLVHFQRGVFTLETYLDTFDFQYLLSFPYLDTDADIQEYYTFCGASKNPKLKESGIWENGNNSIHARFSSQAARQSRSRQKKAEVNSDPATKGLRSLLKATEKVSKENDLEIQCLNARLNDLSRPVASSSQRQLEASTPCRGRSIKSLNNCQGTPLSHEIIDLDNSPPHTASPMKALNLFPGLRLMTPIAEPRSGFDYTAALNSDVLDYTLNTIIEEHPMYSVDGDDEVLALDPYPTPLSRST
ncbi:hypothetical protein K438DRAFT_1770124 [Mycena galopus ATCC 62051]|nr:hypothetical protein K438DRAFT_1770124 [Mycena galopus ATCC 62051]